MRLLLVLDSSESLSSVIHVYTGAVCTESLCCMLANANIGMFAGPPGQFHTPTIELSPGTPPAESGKQKACAQSSLISGLEYQPLQFMASSYGRMNTGHGILTKTLIKVNLIVVNGIHALVRIIYCCIKILTGSI